jgi:hypothetical protein
MYDIFLSKKVLIESKWVKYSRLKDVRNLKVIQKIIEEKYPKYLLSFNRLLKLKNKLELQSVFIV